MKRFIVLLSFHTLLSVSYRLTAEKDRRVEPVVLHRPTPVPDRVILTYAGDPATMQAVTWRTDTTVGESIAEIGEASDGPQFSKNTVKVKAAAERLQSDLNEAIYH